MNNNTQFIISIALAVILAGIGIFYSIYSRLSELSFLPKQFILLVDSLLNEYEDINISFKGETISKNLSFFKGVFVNTGRNDIDFSKAEKDLKIILPEGSEVIKAQITTKSKDLMMNVANDNHSSIVFSGGLCKRKEFFEVEAIVSLPEKGTKKKDLDSLIKFDLRLNNINKIKRYDSSISQGFVIEKLISTFLIFTGLIFAASSAFIYPSSFGPITDETLEITYQKVDSVDSDTVQFRISPLNKDSIKIEGIKVRYNQKESIYTFASQNNWTPAITKISEDQRVYNRMRNKQIAFFITIGVVLFTFIKSFISTRIRSRYLKLVEKQ